MAMAQTANAKKSSGRELALARRRAMSSGGKTGVQTVQASPSQAVSMTAAPARRAVGTVTSVPSGSGRSASMARRKAMSSRGKVGVPSTDRTRSGARSTATPAAAQAPASEASAEVAAAKGDCGCGCKGSRADKAGVTTTAAAATPRNGRSSAKPPRRAAVSMSSGRAASVARRRALSSRGKSGIGKSGLSAAQTARAANPNLSGRELAQALRTERSRNGSSGKKATECSGQRRQRKAPSSQGAAEDAPWKVGASETSRGMTVTGTMVGRSHSVTGDEPSTCRAVTGTEYLGADIFRNFCQAEPAASPSKVGMSPTARGTAVTGSEVGRSQKVTGDEPGTCKRVTGTEYVGAGQSKAFCGVDATAGPSKVTSVETRKGKSVTGSNVGRSSKVTGDEPGAGRELTGTQYMQTGNGAVPPKVGVSGTLRGGSVTGTMVGRSERVTGDEPGACRNVTGDDYVGQEQFSNFCKTAPAPKDFKVGVSKTFRGERVTGTMTGRSTMMTGDEPGTCKAITGTPYAGAEQYAGYCKADTAAGAEARMQASPATFGAPMTGQQPGIAGNMTGDQKGACEPVTGTPYVGADQAAAACPATAATPMSPDFPQQMSEAPWGAFSVGAPMHATQEHQEPAGVTGTQYERGDITGPFGMGVNKVTGTEQARFGRGNGGSAVEQGVPAQVQEIDGRVKARITGEGMDAGLKITGDDWGRGDVVTGTEGTSAKGRNPTRRGGPMSAMAPLRVGSRNEELAEPVSKVTGGSGNTGRGSLITYSGGARG
jgi:hypothetical protein